MINESFKEKIKLIFIQQSIMLYKILSPSFIQLFKETSNFEFLFSFGLNFCLR